MSSVVGAPCGAQLGFFSGAIFFVTLRTSPLFSITQMHKQDHQLKADDAQLNLTLDTANN